MQDHLTIAVIVGTTRAQRLTPRAAKYIASFGRSLDNVDIIYVDPTDFHFAGDGNDPEGKDPRYTAVVDKADAFFIVTPEYNHSFPGSLKRMLDSELALYNHKPVAIAGVSNGNWGGVRAVEQLHLAIRELGLVALSWDTFFPYVQNIFNEVGEMNAEYRERYDAQVGKLYSELIWFAKLLKTARENS